MTRDVRVTMLGSGSWGTTVAGLASWNAPTLLWARSPETAEEITTQHTNSRYLGDRRLPAKLRATADLQEAAEHADVLVVGVPSHSMRSVLGEAAPTLRPGSR